MLTYITRKKIMISLKIVLLILVLHWLSDFVLQTDWMAKNKSTSNKALGLHILVYSIPFLVIGWKFALFNGVLHFGVDYVTSRMSKKFYEKGDIHNFFVVIGFDQVLHYSMLFTLYYLGVR